MQLDDEPLVDNLVVISSVIQYAIGKARSME